MAVTSGLSLSPDFQGQALAAKPRSAWALSWPLALGMVLFVFLANAEGLPLLGDPDSHWHIAVGNWMLAKGARSAQDRVYGIAPGAILASHDQREEETELSHERPQDVLNEKNNSRQY